LELAVDFMKHPGETHGNFLFYSDSGAMALIMPREDTQQVLKKFSE